MITSYRHDEILQSNIARKPGSDCFGTCLFNSERDRSAMCLLIACAEPNLLLYREYLVQPVLAEASYRAADAYDAAEINTDTQNHYGSPERPQREAKGGGKRDLNRQAKRRLCLNPGIYLCCEVGARSS